jgi:hypothetical protein
MDPDAIESKMEVARQKKATADAAFKAGNLTDGKHYVHRQTPLPFIDHITAQLLERITRCAFHRIR